MVGIRSPTNCQANGLNHSSRGQRPRKTSPCLFRPVRAIHRTHLRCRGIPCFGLPCDEHRRLSSMFVISVPFGLLQNQKTSFTSIFQSRLGRAKSRQVAPSPDLSRNYIFLFLCAARKPFREPSVLFVPSVPSSLSTLISVSLRSVANSSKIRGIAPKPDCHAPKIYVSFPIDSG
jgi:hypothetical protein